MQHSGSIHDTSASTTWFWEDGAPEPRPGADYNRFLDALTAAKAQAGIKDTATAFGLLPDLAEKHPG